MREKLKPRKGLIKAIFFLIEFNLLALPMYAAIYFNLSFQPLQIALAYSLFGALRLLGYPATLSSYFVAFPGSSKIIDISWDSTGWKSLYALTALVIATPLPGLNKKLKFLLWALPALFLINFVRILTTILISLKFGFQHFEIVHTFLWREGLIAAVVLLWALYLFRAKNNYW